MLSEGPTFSSQNHNIALQRLDCVQVLHVVYSGDHTVTNHIISITMIVEVIIPNLTDPINFSQSFEALNDSRYCSEPAESSTKDVPVRPAFENRTSVESLEISVPNF
ncbi:hypothetical protein Tco_1546412 [Tanacetum coccineum]